MTEGQIVSQKFIYLYFKTWERKYERVTGIVVIVK